MRQIIDIKSFLLVAIYLLATGILNQAFATTIYVDASNFSGIEDGTQTNPFNTITEGIDAATRDLDPPDVVSVAPGIYVGQIVWKSGVILRSEQGADVTIVDGNGASQVFMPPPRPADFTSGYPRGFIDGFTIRNGNTLLPVYSRYATYQTGEINVDNCVLEDATNAVQGYFFSRLNMDRSVIRNVRTAVIGSIAFNTLNNVTIDNVDRGVLLYGSYLYVYNTTITNVQITGIEASCNFYNCSNVYGSHVNRWNADIVLGNRNNWKSRYVVTNEMAEDPLFINPPLDHRLDQGSPLIDAGTNVGFPFVGDAPDIGAYEYNLDIPAIVENLVEVIQEVPPEAFQNAAEQRQKALTNKLDAVLDMLDRITDSTPISEQIAILNEALKKLEKDILAKTDGYFGGNPKNDWIETQEGQELVYPIVIELIEAVQAELDELEANV